MFNHTRLQQHTLRPTLPAHPNTRRNQNEKRTDTVLFGPSLKAPRGLKLHFLGEGFVGKGKYFGQNFKFTPCELWIYSLFMFIGKLAKSDHKWHLCPLKGLNQRTFFVFTRISFLYLRFWPKYLFLVKVGQTLLNKSERDDFFISKE